MTRFGYNDTECQASAASKVPLEYISRFTWRSKLTSDPFPSVKWSVTYIWRLTLDTRCGYSFLLGLAIMVELPRWQYIKTSRMHSSRMRTAYSLTVSCSILGGGCLPNPLDADPLHADALDADPPDTDPRADTPGYKPSPWTDPSLRRPLLRRPLTGQRPHPVNRITDRWKNITFPQLLLRAVTIKPGSLILHVAAPLDTNPPPGQTPPSEDPCTVSIWCNS